jgi:hypothetical protein
MGVETRKILLLASLSVLFFIEFPIRKRVNKFLVVCRMVVNQEEFVG